MHLVLLTHQYQSDEDVMLIKCLDITEVILFYA